MINKNTDPETELENEFNLKQKNMILGIVLGLLILIIIYIGYLVITQAQNPEITPDIDVNIDPIAGDEIIDFKSQILESFSYSIDYTMPTGDSVLEIKARKSIQSIIDNFIDQAETDRQIALAEDGELPEYLQRPYELKIKSDYYANNDLKITSIVSGVYSYSGGANGYGYYDVITLDSSDQELNDLAEIVQPIEIGRVKEIVVKKLEQKDFGSGTGASTLFPEALQNLRLQDVKFAFNDNKIILFFNEYQVGPGSIGSFTLDLDIDDLEAYFSF